MPITGGTTVIPRLAPPARGSGSSRGMLARGALTSRPRTSAPSHMPLTARVPASAVTGGAWQSTRGTNARHGHRVIVKRRRSVSGAPMTSGGALATASAAAASSGAGRARSALAEVENLPSARAFGKTKRGKSPAHRHSSSGASNSSVETSAPTGAPSGAAAVVPIIVTGDGAARREGSGERRVTLSERLRQSSHRIIALQTQLREARVALAQHQATANEGQSATARQLSEARACELEKVLRDVTAAKDALRARLREAEMRAAEGEAARHVAEEARAREEAKARELEEELAQRKAHAAMCEAAVHKAEAVMQELVHHQGTKAPGTIDSLMNAKNRAELKLVGSHARMKDMAERHGEEVGGLETDRAHLEARVQVLTMNAQHLRDALRRRAASPKPGADVSPRVVKVIRVPAPAPKPTPMSPPPVAASCPPPPSPSVHELVSKLRKQLAAAKAQSEAKGQSVARLTKQIVDLSKKVKELETSTGKACSERDAATKARADAVSKRDKEVAAAKAAGEQTAGALRKQLTVARNKISEQQQELIALQGAAARRAAEDAEGRDLRKRLANADKENAALKAKIAKLEADGKAARTKAGERLREVRAAAQADMGNIRAELAAAQAANKKTEASLRSSMASAAEARAEAAALVAKLEECRTQASAGIRAVADLEAAAGELAAARAKLDEQQGQLAELEALRARIIELEAELAASKDQCARLTGAFADAKRAQPQLRLAREELERLQMRLKEAETMIEDQGHQLAGRLARIEMLEQQLADAEAQHRKAAEEAAAASGLTRALADAQAEATSLQKQLTRSCSRELALQEKLTRAETEGTCARVEANEANKRASALQRQLDAASSESGKHGKALEALRQQVADLTSTLAARDKALQAAKSEGAASTKALRARLATKEASHSRAEQKLRGEVAALKQELEQTQRALAEARKAAAEGEADADKLATLTRALEAARAELSRMQSKWDAIGADKDKHMSSMAKKHKLALANEQDRTSRTQSSLNDANRRCSKLETQLQEAQTKNKRLAMALRDAKRKAGGEAESVTAHQATIRELQAQLAAALAKAAEAAKAADAAASAAASDKVSRGAKRESLALIDKVRQGLDAEMKARDGVHNLKILFKAAENAEMRKEMEKLTMEVQQSKEKINIMLYNVRSAEKVLSKYDPAAAKKHAKAREEQFVALKEKIAKTRKNSASFKDTSVLNVKRLKELMPKSKGKVDVAVKQRGKLVGKLVACMQ